MRFTRTAVLAAALVAIGATGCVGRKEAGPATPGGAASEETRVTSAHWVWDRAALGTAVASASSSPLVQRALRDAPDATLPIVSERVVRAEGTFEGGGAAAVTILPYASSEDRTRATIVALLSGDEGDLAERSELIVGRAPFADESGFEPVVIGGRTIWFRTDATYSLTGDGVAQAVGAISKKRSFVDCFLQNYRAFADAGAKIATEDAPDVPWAGAVGAGAGMAAAAIYCFARIWI